MKTTIVKSIVATFFRGLTAVLPIVLTIYLFYWLGTSVETHLGGGTKRWLGTLYFPGLGIIIALLLVFSVGLLTRAWLVRQFLRFLERWIEGTPVVKTVYGGFKDMMFFVRGGASTEHGAVVLVEAGGYEFMALVTRDSADELIGEEGEGKVAVYVPMAYQLGGFLVIVPRDRVRRLDMDVSEGLRMILTAGVQSRSDD